MQWECGYNRARIRNNTELLGRLMDTKWLKNSFIYLAYSYNKDGKRVKVVRYRYADKQFTEPKTIVDDVPGTALHSGMRCRFGPDGKPRLEPEARGAVGAIGRLVATLYSAMQDVGWERLKLCSSDPCRWAFYDRSKNQSSRWCKMASCGNREKARRFREAHKHS